LIGTRHVKAFLEKPRHDFRQAKAWTAVDIQNYLHALPAQPPIWNKLHQDQKICLLLGAQMQHFAFFNDTGTGKTLLSIALARYFEEAKIGKRFFVLVQRRVNKWEWAREIRKHDPTMQYCILKGSSRDKWEQLEGNHALLTIDTYPGFARMLCNKFGNKLHPDRDLVDKWAQQFQGFFLDESFMVQNHRSLAFRICRQLRKSMPISFALTGTPFGRDPMALWAQMFLVDQGDTLGDTLGIYRGAFFKTNINYWGGYEYTFDKNKKALLHQILAHRSIRYEANAADLPEIVPIRKYVSLPQDTNTYYQKAREEIRKAKGNKIIIRNMFLRMRQISSGFLGYVDDDNGAKAQFEFPYNPKLELLLSVLESIDPDHKVIVFHDFIWSGDKICKALGKMKIGYLRIDGRTKDTPGTLERYDKDAAKQVLVLNNSMATGLNLQIAIYGIYYESPVPVTVRTQSRRRFERQGSEVMRKFQYDLICRRTVDERILEFHREGADLFEAICDGSLVI